MIAGKKEQKGFTLVELITVIAMVSLMAVYLSIEMSSASEDAKIAMASTFLLDNVPKAISSFRARHNYTCSDLNVGPGGTGAVDATVQLTDRGLFSGTPWEDVWAARYNSSVRQLTIEFPTTHADDPAVAARIIGENVHKGLQVVFAHGGSALASPVGPTGNSVVIDTTVLTPGTTGGTFTANHSVGCTASTTTLCITYKCN